jgi:hypothetical protein
LAYYLAKVCPDAGLLEPEGKRLVPGRHCKIEHELLSRFLAPRIETLLAKFANQRHLFSPRSDSSKPKIKNRNRKYQWNKEQ